MDELIYTVAIDEPGQFLYRNLAKLLVSSIVRSGFEGKIVIIHNGDSPIFRFTRKNVFEEPISLPDATGESDFKISLAARWRMKHQAASIIMEYQWSKVLFLDADCLVVNRLDSFFQGDWDILICREPGQMITDDQFNCFLSDEEMHSLQIEGVNSGVFCVRRESAEQFFSLWSEVENLTELRRRCCDDQAALNRLVLDNCQFTYAECSKLISMPFHTDRSVRRSPHVSVVHYVGAIGYEKLKASFGLFMECYFFDPSLTLFNLIES